MMPAPPAGFWLKTPDFGLASDKVCEPEIFCASGTLVAQGVLFPAGTAGMMLYNDVNKKSF